MLWSAETPNLYKAEFSLLAADGSVLHRENEIVWFPHHRGEGERRNVHQRGAVNIRGVNRHSFRPETGRTLSKAKNIEDVLLIKDMNMNSVRLSHYPTDPEFLQACDSLGLYVMR